MFWCTDNLSQAFYSTELKLRDWGGHLPTALDLMHKRIQNGSRKERDWSRYIKDVQQTKCTSKSQSHSDTCSPTSRAHAASSGQLPGGKCRPVRYEWQNRILSYGAAIADLFPVVASTEKITRQQEIRMRSQLCPTIHCALNFFDQWGVRRGTVWRAEREISSQAKLWKKLC